MLTGKEYIRYNRQIMLEKHGEQGQEKLKASSALIIGLGGLGCPVAQYLATAGVGRLILVDDDIVESTNLHRQVLFSDKQVGKSKVLAAAARLSDLNPHLKIITKSERATTENLNELALQSDVILDCSDNIETRYAINKTAFSAQKKLVIGSAIRYEGQVISFDFSKTESSLQGCYQCLIPDANDEGFNCATSGVIGPILGVIGSMQALSAIKALTGEGFISNQWQCFDGLNQQWLSITHDGDPGCSVCGNESVK